MLLETTTPFNGRSPIGRKFARLTPLEYAGKNERSEPYWHCMCDCGNKVTILGRSLFDGRTVSCGCYQREQTSKARTTHGDTNSFEHRVWKGLFTRCSNPNHQSFKYYGGRGVKICERWRNYQNFLDDMGRAPSGMTIGRRNNDGNYEPGNCRWETDLQQANNMSSNRVLSLGDKTMTLAEWARHLGIKAWTLYARLDKYGWSVERALTTRPKICRA